MPKRIILLIVAVTLLVAILIFAGTRMKQSPPPPQEPQPSSAPVTSPTPTPPAYTTLEMTPNSTSLGQATEGSVQVLMNTDQNVATGVQLELSYDPKVLTNVVVTPGTFFENPLIIPQWNKVDQTTGRISHAQVLQPSQNGVKGKGVVATISFAKVAGTTEQQTKMEFLPQTAVTQSGISPSVLKSASGATINL